ncbi:MAG: hypothetical protein CSB34_01750 [Desulfobulbus propionicus]|nr:MAG: hypothetical protein CSB34_01750 [Desulfobulbus propionicus]
MLEVTDSATASLKEYVQEFDYNKPIRITIMRKQGCSGVGLGLVFDDPKESDKTFSVDIMTFVVEEKLLNICEGIKVDFIDLGTRKGFVVSSQVPIEGASCGNCTGECEE